MFISNTPRNIESSPKNFQNLPVDFEFITPDISNILTEDDTPVDNLITEKEQRLLTTTLYSYFKTEYIYDEARNFYYLLICFACYIKNQEIKVNIWRTPVAIAHDKSSIKITLTREISRYQHLSPRD